MSDSGLHITPRPDLPAIVARWQREISAAELRAGYFAVLAAADAHACRRWLLDLRRREELASAELSHWLNHDFFPRLLQRYDGVVRIAFLISPLRAQQQNPHHAEADSSAAAISARTSPEQGYTTAVFTDEAAAYHWLAL